MKYEDFRGEPIREGSRIVYAVSQGSTVEMRQAEVLDIVDEDGSFRLKVEAQITQPSGDTESKIVFLSRVDRVAVVE